MNWNEFLDDLKHKTFCPSPEDSATVCRWLRLLKTSAVWDWAEGSRRVGDAKYGDKTLSPVLELLLERHVLHLAHRRNPRPLSDFWKWATPEYDDLHNLWEDANLPATLVPPTVRKQEDAFAEVLSECTQKLTAGPDWAHYTLARLAQALAVAHDEPAKNAYARVVFAWEGKVPEEFRPALVVEFKLLAEVGHGDPIRPSDRIFAPGFLDPLKDVASRVGAGFRAMEHDWDFLGDRCLTGSSGMLAVWLAQLLAGRGWDERGLALAMPPWAIVTATLDRNGRAAGGAAAAVELVPEKARLLIEDGVRVMFVSDQIPNATWHNGETTAELLCPGVPGAEDLHVFAILTGEGVEELGENVRGRACVWPVNLGPLRTD